MTAPPTESRKTPRIESDDLSLGDLFKDFYCVPDFQREYVWEPENVERLLTDVTDEFEGTDTGAEYFIGSIVCCKDDDGTFQLIDGQQRLTTVFLTVCAIRDHLLELKEKPSDSLRGFIRASSMDPNTGEDVARYRLSLQYDDSRGVLDTIAAGSFESDAIGPSTASVRHILDAYDAIREFLSERFPTGVETRKFLAAFMSRVKLIRIVTPNLSHALKVFETINDRGVGLNAMDLLKNLLFMRTGSREYAKLKDVWKRLIDAIDAAREKPLRFLRYYILANFEGDAARPLREDEIYSWLVDNSAKCGIDAQPLVFANALVESATEYGRFLAGKDARGQPIPSLENIKALGGAVRQHLILLLAARKLPALLFETLCDEMERLLFCYFVTKEQTKNFERSFTRWAPTVRAVRNEADLEKFINENFRADLLSRVAQFDFALANLTASAFQQYRLRYILAKLTQFVDSSAWDNPRPLSHYLDKAIHVEHILPQRPAPGVREAFDKPADYEKYVSRLGNLTLLEKTINTSVSNSGFDAKKEGYSQSGLLLTKTIAVEPRVGNNTALNRAVHGLAPFPSWTSEAIERRQKDLCKLARRVWLPAFPDSPSTSN